MSAALAIDLLGEIHKIAFNAYTIGGIDEHCIHKSANSAEIRWYSCDSESGLHA